MSEEELDYEEDQDHLNEPKRQVAIRGEAKNVRLRHRECDICFHTFTNPRRHTIQTHLPWYVAPETACWICGTQEQTANFLSKHITRCHPTNSIDATFKNREVMYAELMNGLLRELARALGKPPSLQWKYKESNILADFAIFHTDYENTTIVFFNSLKRCTCCSVVTHYFSSTICTKMNERRLEWKTCEDEGYNCDLHID
ncbi:unnamed protein product [Mytilus coruscus]|uniref:Uncharacterized protein n=1 Tax=Mytilus coruscus TaxID=42192 RepID=A0A6J7ZZP4_MYTCO|nr:unnamed protein product [Mytilus coruscus]